MDKKIIIFMAVNNNKLYEKFLDHIQRKYFEIKNFASGSILMTNLHSIIPDYLIISTKLKDLSAIHIMDSVNCMYQDRVKIIAVIDDGSIDMQKEVVKRNVLCKFIGSPDFGVLEGVFSRVVKNRYEKTGKNNFNSRR